MKYAVIRIKGNQFKVSEGEEILIGKLGEEKPEAEVLLLSENGKVKLGKPTLKDTKVKLKVIEKEEKGEKLHVMTFKAKSRYRRKKGFRPVYSRILIEKIG